MLELEREKNIENNNGWAFLIWAIPLVLSLCGTMMIASLSLRNNTGTSNPYTMPIKQLIYLGLGIVAMFIVSVTSIKKLRSISSLLWVISATLLAMTLIPRIGVSVGGARRWLNVGFMRFQPLEFLMFALPLFLADRLDDAKKRDDWHAFLRPTLMLIVLSAWAMTFQHLGGAALVLAVSILMYAENRGGKYLFWSMILGLLLFSVLIWIAPYRIRRLQSFLDPWNDPQGKGYQIIQGLIAFANGGLSGLGIGKGLQESRYLPASQTDYIFAAIGEEFGLLGTIFLLLLYAGWTWRIYKMYTGLKDPFLSNLTIGLTASVICPMFVNLAGVMHVLPLTGIPMPFLSAGGSAMLFMWMKIGALIAISQWSPRKAKALPSYVKRPARVPRLSPEESEQAKQERRRSRRRQNLGPVITLPPSSFTPSFSQNSKANPDANPSSSYKNYRSRGINRGVNRPSRGGRDA